MIVEPMEHIAICGRSGSGKTSVMLAILKMMVIQDGYVEVDGVDLTSISGEDLRRSLNVAPRSLPYSRYRPCQRGPFRQHMR